MKSMSIARTKYRVTKSLLLLGILVTGLLSCFIGLVAFFGQYMGTFVISLDDDTTNIGIALSENVDFSNPQTRLLVNPVNEAHPETFNNINFVDAVTTDGNLNNTKTNNYIAFTFYVRNEGNAAVDLDLNIDTLTVTNDVDSAVRIILIENGGIDENGIVTMSDGKLYMKDDGYLDERAALYLDPVHQAVYDQLNKVYFTDEPTIDQYSIDNFKPGDMRKYTLIIWLEGWDANCNDNIKRGQLKMKLEFSIRNLVSEE